MKIERNWNKSNSKDTWNLVAKNIIAILSDNKSYGNEAEKILRKTGRSVDLISPKNSTRGELQNCFMQIVDKVQIGNYNSALVISTDAYMIKQSLVRYNNLIANICWEIDENNSCTTKSKFLLINSDLIGFKKLEEKIVAWLKFNNY